jgi:exoribonuclease-2
VEKGKLIELRVGGERRLAVADRPEGKKDWIVIEAEGQSHKIRPQRIEYEISGGNYSPAEIPQFLQEVQPYLDPASLEVAWELLADEGQPVTPAEMAQLLFSHQSPAQCYAAHSLLCEDKIYFKKKGDSYEPRPASQVAEIKHQLEVEQQRQQEKTKFLEQLEQALAGKAVEWTDSDRQRLESLEKLALDPDQTTRTAQETLHAAGRQATAEAARELLVSLGWWQPHENLFLRRSSYPRQFPKKVLEVAQAYLDSPPPELDSRRLDLTHLKVYTIDDASTEEIDDGLSVETLAEGKTRFWIHIADPSYLISPGDELDLQARRRSTSLYLPTGTIPMFPPQLATGPMSLIQGQRCPALSFAVVLDGGGVIEDYEIYPSLIEPTYRLTYEDVQEILHLDIAAEAEIGVLAAAARQRRLWRQSQGAIDIQMPETTIKVSPQDEIAIEVLESSPARQLVAEMMILAGEVAGRYCQENNLPVPFRGQPQPDLPPEAELLQLPPGPVRACALRRCMPRSEVGITPTRHASLGLAAYTQVTSPIRRYTDLLAHFQLKAHLRGESLPFSSGQMQEIIYGVAAAAQEATSVERQTNRYWGLEYLRRHADHPWQVLVLRWLREDDYLALILLEDLGLELPHRFERSVTLGDRLTLQVSRADPHRDEIRFNEL